ncbi:hypothetical protein ARMSODRAFT_1026719 [Armillaria solidipes]|uniref:Uncharacterized protein n=1 Tax=Armillaria solidipes TaxID=1076256 RepID=A0A2H3BBA1_9AGAR|nr:hypothetical protein ARMSODRAFT_1026719 [Armillaria solidipes]
MSGESATEEQDELDSQHSTDLTPTPAAIDVNGSAWEWAQEQPVVGKGGTTLVGLTSRTGSDNAMRPSLSRTMDTDLSTAQDGSAENSITNTVDNARDNSAAVNDAMGDRLAILAASGSGVFMVSPGHEIADILESEIVVGRGSKMRGISGYKCAAGGELEGEEDDRIQGNTGDSAVVADDPTRKHLDIAVTLQHDHMEDTESEIIERSGGKTHANGSEWAGLPELGHERVAGKSPYNISASSMPDATHDTGKELYKNWPSQILLALQQDDADITPSEANADNCEEITDGDILKELRHLSKSHLIHGAYSITTDNGPVTMPILGDLSICATARDQCSPNNPFTLIHQQWRNNALERIIIIHNSLSPPAAPPRNDDDPLNPHGPDYKWPILSAIN